MHLVLASASPRRAELLTAAGYTFDVVVADVDESVRSGELPATYVRRLAAEKSAAAFRIGTAKAVPHGSSGSHVGPRFSGADLIVIGADTTVVVDGEILAKAADAGEARAMLERLSGRRHDVLTGISLRCGAYEVGRVESTAVWFAALTNDDIEAYLASAEWQDKAGAYAIQGRASRFIPRIDGSYSNVVGLPVAAVAELLTEFRQRDRDTA